MISSQNVSGYRRNDTASRVRSGKTNGKYTPCTRTGVAGDNPYGLTKHTTVRPRRRMEDNNKMGLKMVEMESAKCTELAQDSDKWKVMVNTVTKLRTAPTVENYLTE